MKKYLSSFLISFVLISNLIVPVSVFGAEEGSTIKITGLDVTGTEILVSTTSIWKDVADVKKTREIKVLLFNNNSDTYIKEKTIENRSDVSGIGTTIFNSLDGLKPETDYRIRAYIKETTIKTLTDTTELIYNTESFVNVKTGAKNQTNFNSVATNNVVNVTGKQIAAGDKYDPIYHLLAPIGTFTEIKTDDIGGYFDKIFLIAIGLCGALAVIMFIIGGIQYMGDESIFGKTKGKEQMTGAILGLLIALGSWALLNTINPDLLGGSGLLISSAKITLIDKPDAGDNTVDPDFNKGNESYSTSGAVSSGVTEAVSKLKNSSSISSFNVSTSSKTMTITMGDGFSTQSVPIDIGLGGVSEVGAGITGDNKTPKGNWKILEVRTSAGGKPVFSKKGSNMGASFWLLSPTTNGDRGIGMHGNKNGTLSITNGCIRLKNSDILALLPYIKSGISVNIQ